MRVLSFARLLSSVVRSYHLSFVNSLEHQSNARTAGYTGKVKLGMDVAASEFYKEGKYDLDFKNPNSDASKVRLEL